MAAADESTETSDPPTVQTSSWSKEERIKNKQLRHAGLEYISRSGRTVAAKKQPDVICNCPQQCSTKVTKEIRERLFADFYALGDANSQNNYLRKLIEIRSVNERLFNEERKESGRLQRRITCKYRVPLKLSPRDKTLTPITDINESQNDISVGETETCLPHGDSDNDKDDSKVDEAVDRRDSNDRAKITTEDLSLLNPSNESMDNTNETSDSKENEQHHNKNLTEGKESCKEDIGDKIEAGKIQGVITAGGKPLTEQKLDAVDENKSTEVKLETSIPSSEIDKKSDNPSTLNLTNNGDHAVNTTPKPEEHKDTVDICQKAFMNIFAITEKRVRLQRERIIDELRFMAEKRKAEQEEMENSINVARELAAGCRPLLHFMDKSNQSNRIPSLPNKLLMAIDNDLTLVNNFFRNQLWKPENFNKRYKCDDSQLEHDILD
nr:PREDICTED: uncharacterized protein LOC109036032 [Bemisia tabaci]